MGQEPIETTLVAAGPLRTHSYPAAVDAQRRRCAGASAAVSTATASARQDEAARVGPPRGSELAQPKPRRQQQRDADGQRDRLAEDELAQLAHQAVTGSRTSAAIWPWETISRVAAM